MPEKRIKLKKINNESLVGTGNISVLTSHQDISGKLDKAQTSYKGKNVVVDSASGNITFEDKPTIPTDVSDLTDSSNTAFTPKSHTHGNLQNDGSIGTSNNASKNVVTDSNGKITIEAKPTIPSASSSTPSADTSNGSVGTGTSYARADHKHPKSSIYAEASHNHTKSQITDFPSLATVATSGSYDDLTDKPNIPQEVTVDASLSTSSNNAIANSTVTNALNGKSDTGHTHSQYLTSHQSLSGYLQTSDVKNNLTSTDTDKPLSALQGKSLKAIVDGKAPNNHTHNSNDVVNIAIYDNTISDGHYDVDAFELMEAEGLSPSENLDNFATYTNVVLNSKASSSHEHGDITTDGKITSSTVGFSGSDVPLVSDASASGKIQKGVVPTGYIKDDTSQNYTNIGLFSTGQTQKQINTAINSTIGKKVSDENRITTTFFPQDYQYTMSNGSWDNKYKISLNANGQLALNLASMFTIQDDSVDFIVQNGSSQVVVGILVRGVNTTITSISANSTIRINITLNNDIIITISDTNDNILEQFGGMGATITFQSSSSTTLSFGEKKWSHIVPFIDRVYPIGSIYMSMNSVDPSLFIGGEWEQIQDKFLLASGSTYTAGTTGGSANAIVVSHSHSPQGYDYFIATSGSGVSRNSTAGQTGTKVNNLLQSADAVYRVLSDTQGESGTGKNMPPYLTVYMWKRIG